MLGLDEHLAQLGHGEVFAAVVLVAVLLGLRHATDPDHLAAVSALIAGDETSTRSAGRLGLSWGLGHATALLGFGVPIVVAHAYLPEGVQRAAETAVGIMIVALAIRLLRRSRRQDVHAGAGRSPLQAFGIGLIHGVGGSAGVGILLLAAMPSHAEALAALALFSLFSAVSMTLATTAFGFALSRGPALRGQLTVVPALGALSLAFGLWYSLGALGAVPYLL